jgi:hypothetical protein
MPHANMIAADHTPSEVPLEVFMIGNRRSRPEAIIGSQRRSSAAMTIADRTPDQLPDIHHTRHFEPAALKPQ